MHGFLVEWLLCPRCHGDLVWQIDERDGARIELGRARCLACDGAYPIRDGIGLFLLPELPRDDLWQNVDSALLGYLRENPAVEQQLMDCPIESLGPADQFFRAMVLEEEGDFDGAAEAEALSLTGSYTAEYRACSDSQMAYVLELASQRQGPIVDLACGRGYLVRRLANLEDRLVVASDFSPRVLRRNRRWLEHIGLYDRVSLLAFDARRIPFQDGVLPLLTTYVGLPNIESPGDLLVELRRVTGGLFAAISHFYPAGDEANRQVLRQAGLELLLIKEPALAQFAESGWQVEVANSCRCPARPTPTGEVLEGAGLDGLPVADTELEWCVIVAS
ncbi:MAG: methyltransferase domain-containing protein [Chloroflexota bacterium]|jgi:uncharacterized protein YbaR (Trm112 family)/SAM-dependent methyltransferase